VTATASANRDFAIDLYLKIATPTIPSCVGPRKPMVLAVTQTLSVPATLVLTSSVNQHYFATETATASATVGTATCSITTAILNFPTASDVIATASV